MRYLILNSFLLLVVAACAGDPPAEPFEADFEFVVNPGQATKACLSEDSVAKLREALIRCKAGGTP